MTNPASFATKRLLLISVLLLSAWCGMVAGILEVSMIVIRKEAFDSNHLYGMSRHFVWLIPVTNLGVCLVLGFFLWIVGFAWPNRARWLLPRILCAITLLPMVLIAFPRIYSWAWLAVTAGVAARLVPVLELHRRQVRRFVQLSFPVAFATLLLLAASPWIRDRIEQSRAGARPLPPPGSPNLI